MIRFKDKKISMQCILHYFYNNYEGNRELTDEFIYRVNVNGFDNSITNILQYAVETWANAEPGSQSGHASKFIDYLTANNQLKADNSEDE